MRVLRLLLLSLTVTFFGGAPAFAFGDCNSRDYVNSFGVGAMGDEACEVVANFDIRHDGDITPMRVVRPRGSAHRDDALWISHIRELARRLGPAMSAMGRLTLKEVTIYLSTGRREDVHAWTRRRTGTECKVVFFKVGSPVTAEEFGFTYAHEVFHCIQNQTWPSKMSVGGTSESVWWIEGSAEYFAHLVQPSTSFGDEYINDYDVSSLNNSLVSHSYDSVVFFLWYNQMRGPENVRRLLEGLPGGAERMGQVLALQRFVPIDEWLRFGEMYWDGQIVQPGGRRVPAARATLETLAFSGTARRNLELTEAYTVTRRHAMFERGKSYRLRVESASGAAKTQMAQGSTSSWGNPPERVSACRERKQYRVLTASVEGRGENVLDVQASPHMQDATCCLVGAWAPTPAALNESARAQNQVASLIPSEKEKPQCSYVGGSWLLHFDEDRKGDLEWKDFQNVCRLSAKHGEMRLNGRTSGKTTFTWRELEGSVWVSYTGSNVTGSMDMTVGGRSLMQRVIPLSPPLVTNHAVAFQCQNNDLSISQIYGLHGNAAHKRIGTALVDR